MTSGEAHRLSARERQMMDVVWQRGEATAQEIRDAIPEPPSYSAVRATLAILERKGHLRHRIDGARYIYIPVESTTSAGRQALMRVVDTFFEGSPERAVAALLKKQSGALDARDVARLKKLIDQSRRKGR